MLQGKSRVCRSLARAGCIAILTCAIALPADGPLIARTVCEVLRDLATLRGKDIPILGRYSFRENGRWIGEQTCAVPAASTTDPAGAASSNAASAAASRLWLVEDLKDGPKPPGDFTIDGVALRQKIAEMRRHTALGKFRFGTPDYDRWALIYGRVQERTGEDAKTAPANLIFRGSGVIVFVNPEEQ